MSVLVPTSSLVPSSSSAATANACMDGITRRVGANPHSRGGPCSGTHKWGGVGHQLQEGLI